MILVDSSLWIDVLMDPDRLPEATERITEFAVCGPITQEVLQGLDMRRPESAALGDAFLALPRLSDPLPMGLYLQAAEIFMDGWKRGLTIRSGVDCLIAAVAIHNNVELWHRDRDFTKIAGYTRLKSVAKYLT